jgi:hypothetical protein
MGFVLAEKHVPGGSGHEIHPIDRAHSGVDSIQADCCVGSDGGSLGQVERVED